MTGRGKVKALEERCKLLSICEDCNKTKCNIATTIRGTAKISESILEGWINALRFVLEMSGN
jgi:hypothetical protein